VCVYDICAILGGITDDELFETLIAPVSSSTGSGATLYCVIDCCHSQELFGLRHIYNENAKEFETDHNVPGTHTHTTITVHVFTTMYTQSSLLC
jgi:hypothetical protein